MHLRRASWLAVAIGVGVVAATAARARAEGEAPRPPTPYDRGRISLGVSLGTQTTLDERYFAVGGRFGYYVLPGLEVAAGGLKLFGPDPSIAMVSPEVRYVLYPVDWSVRPFAGAFYRHWFIGGSYDDLDTVGGTLGLLWASGSIVLGLGATVEHVVSACDAGAGDDCTMVYPAVIVGLSL